MMRVSVLSTPATGPKKMNKQAVKSMGGSVRLILIAVALGSLAAAMPALAKVRSSAPPAAGSRAATTSFNFNNIPVRSALQLIANEAQFNLVVSDSVQGTISLRLDNVTWEQALEIVLRLKGLQQRVDRTASTVTITD